MQRQRGRHARQPVHLGRVGKFLFNGGRRRSLHKLAKARAGVGKSPRRNLDLERIQRLECKLLNCRIRKFHGFSSPLV